MENKNQQAQETPETVQETKSFSEILISYNVITFLNFNKLFSESLWIKCLETKPRFIVPSSRPNDRCY